ncbi:MAG: hypothetical protein MUP52_03825 [Candidatus Aminicenantes bacterium]|nr:hypothetical protein [Candidatus Aminicenantes bacterium]
MPRVVLGHAVPRLKHHTEKTISAHLQQLADADLIILYEVNGDRYLQYNQFDEHQSGLHKDREAPSAYPPPPAKVRSKSGVGPEKVPLNIIESNIRESKVVEAWNSTNIRNLKEGESKIREKTISKIGAVLKEYPLEVIIKAIENYGKVVHHPELYFFSYKWELCEFLQRGLRKFMDEAQPFENFKIKNGVGRGRREPDSPQVGANVKAEHGPDYWADVRRLKAEGKEGQALTDALAKKAKEGKG